MRRGMGGKNVSESKGDTTGKEQEIKKWKEKKTAPSKNDARTKERRKVESIIRESR